MLSQGLNQPCSPACLKMAPTTQHALFPHALIYLLQRTLWFHNCVCVCVCTRNCVSSNVDSEVCVWLNTCLYVFLKVLVCTLRKCVCVCDPLDCLVILHWERTCVYAECVPVCTCSCSEVVVCVCVWACMCVCVCSVVRQQGFNSCRQGPLRQSVPELLLLIVSMAMLIYSRRCA